MGQVPCQKKKLTIIARFLRLFPRARITFALPTYTTGCNKIIDGSSPASFLLAGCLRRESCSFVLDVNATVPLCASFYFLITQRGRSTTSPRNRTQGQCPDGTPKGIHAACRAAEGTLRLSLRKKWLVDLFEPLRYVASVIQHYRINRAHHVHTQVFNQWRPADLHTNETADQDWNPPSDPPLYLMSRYSQS